MSDEQLVRPPRMDNEQLREIRRILPISSRFGNEGARTGTEERMDGGAAAEGWVAAASRVTGRAAAEGWGAAAEVTLVFSYGLWWQGFFCKKTKRYPHFK